MKTSSLVLKLPSSVLLLLSTALAQQLPYNPTRIFLSPQNERLAYVLHPLSATGSQVALSYLDISSSLDASNLQLQTISTSLPFIGDGPSTSLNAVIDGSGNITVYTGACGNSGQIWKLDTQGRETELPDWTQHSQSQSNVGTTVGPQYLSSSIAFSSNVSDTATETICYFFGGMCLTSASTEVTWQANANYSNSMVSLVPSVENDQIVYTYEFATTRNLPIAQAGQSLTALPPTFSNNSDGSQTQQQDFVLLGGHTQAAFMNMSQVALWSLPQEAWSYFPVAEGDAGTRIDLTVRDTEVQIEPRSGHTAVLSSDGTKIVVLGGWVGDVSTPAQPQLAILNVADEYGGSGDWSWTVPEVPTDNGLGNNAGIYGHGALMLPGDVMLVTGGYAIAAPASRFRRADQTLSSRSYLYNVSSGAWLASYTVPTAAFSQESSSSGPLSTTSERAGLGIGIGVGTVAIAAIIGFYLWYTRRNKKLREEKENTAEDLAFSAHGYNAGDWAMPRPDGPYSKISGTEMSEDREKAAEQVYSNWRSTANQAERTGLLVEIPSPTRGLRRNVSGARVPYPYERRRSQSMEVIEERRDQESSRSSLDQEQSELQKHTAELLQQGEQQYELLAESENPLRSHPIEEENDPEAGRTATERQQEVKGWVQNWEKAAEALVAPRQQPAEGRSSPSKSDRTTSMLSESSGHSSWSSRSGKGSGGAGGPSGIVRTLSTRSAALLNNFAASMTGNGPISPTTGDARSTLPSQQRRRGYSFASSVGAPLSPTRSRPDTAVSVARNDGDSYSTAQTSFAQLQAEGEALLGGARSRGKSEPSSPVKDKRESGWFGSVKRAISGARTTSMAASASASGSEGGSRSSSPQKPGSNDGDYQQQQNWQRRATHDASFLRSRRGAQDWYVDEEEEEDSEIQRPSAPDGEMESDWDVERAVENRVVQLMFTVPRQRLRVVNADDGDARSMISQDEYNR